VVTGLLETKEGGSMEPTTETETETVYGKVHWTGEPWAKEITSEWGEHGRLIKGWPARAKQTRDNADSVVRVYCSDTLRDNVKACDGTPADVRAALWKANVFTAYVRHTKAGMCYVVGIYDPPAAWEHTEGSRAYFGSAGGYGYDKRASAMSGMPLAPGVVFTDHCGLDRYGDHPWKGQFKGIVLGSSLPEPFIVVSS
jgi:hypothetical protein